MKKAQTKKVPQYTVTLSLGNDIYTVKTDSIKEGLEKLQPKKITLQGIFVITKEGGRYEKRLYPTNVYRLLTGSPHNRIIFEKNALAFMKHV